jgi:molybdopterin-guanine dinucleotide biosynthesis protein A
MSSPPLPTLRCAGLVLAGGHSSRLGRDKAGLRFGPQTLLDRVMSRLMAVAAPVVVSRAFRAAPLDLPNGVLEARDERPDGGPLLGLLAGFRRLQGLAEAVVVVPVDAPFLTVPWLARLAAALERSRAVLYEYQGVPHALTAGYRLDLLPKLERLVSEGRSAPQELSAGESPAILRVEELWKPDGGPPPLMDVDTPEDYRDALRLDGFGDPRGVAVTAHWDGHGPREGLPLWAATAAGALGAAAEVYPEDASALGLIRDRGRALAGLPGRERPISWTEPLHAGERVIFTGP